jgi:MFS family permease
MSESSETVVGHLTGVYLAILQFVFNLLWFVYVNYLPQLVAQVGLVAVATLILMLDQLVFTVTDTAMGIAADRVGRAFGRVGTMVSVLSAISCVAFVAMPYIVGTGAGAQFGLIGLIVVWAITSSSMRAPPMRLLGKYRATPSLPFQTALVMLGYGLASGVSPYLGLVLRDGDARIPFIVAGAVLLITALSVSKVERDIAWDNPVDRRAPQIALGPLGAVPVMFVVWSFVLALGFQIHVNINSTPLFQRFVEASEIEWLSPIFWIGYSAAVFPVSIAIRRHGGLTVMGIAGLLGAVAVLIVDLAGTLDVMIAAQLLAGIAWAGMMTSAFAVALTIGKSGSEGKVVGLVFSAQALAQLVRMAAVAIGLKSPPDCVRLLQVAPVTCWLVAGAGLLVLGAPYIGPSKGR